MLKLNPDPTFTTTVKITVPGKEEPATLDVTFKYRGRKELEAFWNANKKKSKKKDAAIFMEIAVGWNWPDVEFTEQNVETFLNNYPAAETEIITAYSMYSVMSRVKN